MLLQRHIEPLERFLFVPRRSSRLVAARSALLWADDLVPTAC